MNKDMVIELGIRIAAIELGVNPIDYAVDYKDVLKENDLTAIYNPESKEIVFNYKWVNNASINDILLVVFHEMRHHYQNIQIKLLSKGFCCSENIRKVSIWMREFMNYNSPYKSKREAYINQDIEKDAINFSNGLLQKINQVI